MNTENTNIVCIDAYVRRGENLKFTDEDRQFLSRLAKSFEKHGLPHELCYGTTDENQEWCLVKKHTYSRGVMGTREQTPVTVVVAELVVTRQGYQHYGNWGKFVANSLPELFKEIMPTAYHHFVEGIFNPVCDVCNVEQKKSKGDD